MEVFNKPVWKKQGDFWQFGQAHDALIVLDATNSTTRNFQVEGKRYELLSLGFWNRQWQIRKSIGFPLLSLKFGFWNNKGIVRFQDGRTFECRLHNSPHLSITFKDLRSGDDLLSYKTRYNERYEIYVDLLIHKNEIPSETLFHLITLGKVLMEQYISADTYTAQLDFITSL